MRICSHSDDFLYAGDGSVEHQMQRFQQRFSRKMTAQYTGVMHVQYPVVGSACWGDKCCDNVVMYSCPCWGQINILCMKLKCRFNV